MTTTRPDRDVDLRDLRRLAASHGVRPFYRDVDGVRRDAGPEALVAVLRALGEPVESPADAPAALAERRRELARCVVEPVCVVWEEAGEAAGAGAPPATVRVLARGRLDCHLELESGATRSWAVDPGRLPVVGEQADGDGGTRPVRRLPLPAGLPRGYHRLTVADAAGDEPGTCLVLVAPRRFYDGGLESNSAESAGWGVFLPVYAIRRETSGLELGGARVGPEGAAADPEADGLFPGDLGVGDLTGLEQLGRWVAGLGGTAVATLPLLSAFLYEDPESYSPYAPASRLFWNELFVDPLRLPELAASPRARRLLASDGLRREVEELSAEPLIDYRRAATLKRQVLEPLAEAFFADDAPEERRGALEELRRRRPDLDDYAAFRAVTERHGVGWQAWPERLRGSGGTPGDLRPGDFDPAAFRYHLYTQLAAEEQVSQAAETLAASGGLYLDLPLGVASSSYDVWREGDLFVTGASAGAPPDPIFTGGQDWGFHPIHPERQRRTGYRHLRAVLRHHLTHAGMLRVDHVMQLHRLFWIPRGVAKSDGVYVRYPAEELYAILSLESHRTRTRVVGENLGTVPPYVDRSLSEHGLSKMYVLPFEATPPAPEAEETASPRPAVPRPLARPVADDEVASLNTHDIPFFRAWWTAAGVDDRHDLGLLSDAQAAEERAGRRVERRAWVRRLVASGHLDPVWAEALGDEDADDAGIAGEEASEAVHAAALAWLGESDSPLVLASLEDLWSESAPQNVPGTWKERPNWRRRASRSLEEIAADDEITGVLRRLDAARRAEPAAPAAPGGPNRISSDAGEMRPVPNRSLLTDDDLYLFNQGRHFALGERFGAQPRRLDGADGYNFAVWAPNAESVAVVGDFNGWDPGAHPLAPRGASGVWEGFLPGAEAGQRYKYFLRSHHQGHRVAKADPYAIRAETPPDTASVLWHLGYEWGDGEWMEHRADTAAPTAPISIYEVHLGSWRRAGSLDGGDDGHRFLSYREVAEPLAEHCLAHGFTHVELLPVMEHPFYGSWGYQVTGYFAPTSRYGKPQDLMYLVDHLHQRGLGVLLDWVPSHFPADEHGLGYFDGTHLYEHADPRLGFHPDWNSFIFNYQRPEVRSFLISSALHWLRVFHADGLRVDAVASMLMRNYSRPDGEWIPNRHGGPENLEAVDLVRQLNRAVAEHAPGARTFAEESTAWPGVTHPEDGGTATALGFDYKWDMGWMHDTLEYLKREPVHRRFHQNEMTFRGMYAWAERYLLPLSHDEVVHGKRSLLHKMPGDEWQRFANLRLLYAWQWAQPGKKLLFMGGEIAQRREWDHDWSLEWHLLDEGRPGSAFHRGISRWVADLNRAYRDEEPLHRLDASPDGFRWIDTSDHERSVLSFLRLGADGEVGDVLLAVFNFTPEPRHDYHLGVPRGGHWEERLNSDAEIYGGSGQGNLGGVDATEQALHGLPWSVSLTLPPLGMVLLKSPAPGGAGSDQEDGADVDGEGGGEAG